MDGEGAALTYLAVLAFIVVGSIWLEWGLRTRVLRRWRRLLATLALALPPFLIWDLYAVAEGHWWFDDAQLLGPTLPGGIPLEELLFFPSVGLASVLTLEAVRSVRQRPLGDEEPSDRDGHGGDRGGAGRTQVRAAADDGVGAAGGAGGSASDVDGGDGSGAGARR